MVVADSPASAQVLGTYPWQMQPYCNVVTLTLAATPTGFTLDGTDDQCGAASKAGVTGTAGFTAGGDVSLAFMIIAVPSARPLAVSATVNPTSGSGTWTDSAGNRGTFTMFGRSTGLAPRPVAAAPPTPFITGSAGRQVVFLTAADVITRTVTVSAPAPGRLAAQASGTFSFGSSGHDMGRCALTTGAAIDFVADAVETDQGSAIPTTYGAWGITRTFDVTGGPVNVNLVCDAIQGTVRLEYSSVTVVYVPQ